MFEYTMEEAANRLTGFDAIEIKAKFGAPLTELDNEIKAVAIYYIHAKRADSTVTYKDAMNLSFLDIRDAFKPMDDATFPGDGTGKRS